MSTEITPKQAMTLLNKSKNPLVLRARYEAIKICQRKETTHSREVRETMDLKGLLHDVADDRWMGSIFLAEFFEDTGQTVAVQDKARNIHKGRDSKLWRLKELYKDIQLPPLDALPHIEATVRLSRIDQLLREAQTRIGGEALDITVSAPTDNVPAITVRYHRRYLHSRSVRREVTAPTMEGALQLLVDTEPEFTKGDAPEERA